MKITIGDKVHAAVGTEAKDWDVVRIFNDGFTNWVTVQNGDYQTTIAQSQFEHAIKTAKPTEITELELNV